MVKNYISIFIGILFLLIKIFSYTYTFVVFLDVGQGDSMLLNQGNFQLIVDAGPGDYMYKGIGKYMPLGDRNIEILIITHPHADHYLGLYDTLKYYDVSNLVVSNSFCAKNDEYDRLIDNFQSKGTNVVHGINYSYSNISVNTFSDPNYCDQSNINNVSLITLISIDNKKIVNMGDMEVANEHISYVIGDIDILKAGHHCSDTSTSARLLEILNPEIVICSVGERNKFGHPSKNILKLISDSNAKYFLTSQVGDILLRLD